MSGFNAGDPVTCYMGDGVSLDGIVCGQISDSDFWIVEFDGNRSIVRCDVIEPVSHTEAEVEAEAVRIEDFEEGIEEEEDSG